MKHHAPSASRMTYPCVTHNVCTSMYHPCSLRIPCDTSLPCASSRLNPNCNPTRTITLTLTNFFAGNEQGMMFPEVPSARVKDVLRAVLGVVPVVLRVKDVLRAVL